MTSERLNNLIDINLKSIYESNGKELYYLDFVDENNERINHIEFHPENIAIEMQEKDLIRLNGENCIIKPKGIEVQENGGWIKYLNEQKNNHEQEKKLKDQIDKLTLSNLQHKEDIKDLEKELKISSLLKNWWWLIASAIGVGTAIGKFLF